MAEAISWLDDRKPLLTSKDHGKDDSSTGMLLQRHLRMQKELAAYGVEMKRLSEQAKSAAQLTSLTVSLEELSSESYKPKNQLSKCICCSFNYLSQK